MNPASRHYPESSRVPLVVKLGGSLYHHVPVIVPILMAAERPLVIVPGGDPLLTWCGRLVSMTIPPTGWLLLPWTSLACM